MSFLQYINPEFLLQTFGLAGVFFIVFAESGLFFGFFLPGDSLLLTAGLFASRGDLNLAALVLLSGSAAIIGDSVGYWFGRKTGEKIFLREESGFFKKSHLLKAQDFYNRHGGKTIILARFMPFVRTFAPIVAGAAKMRYGTFITYNIIGGLIWGTGLPLVGYSLGTFLKDRFTAKQVDNYFLLIVVAVIILSVLPTALHLVKDENSRRHLFISVKNLIYALPGLHPNRKS